MTHNPFVGPSDREHFPDFPESFLTLSEQTPQKGFNWSIEELSHLYPVHITPSGNHDKRHSETPGETSRRLQWEMEDSKQCDDFFRRGNLTQTPWKVASTQQRISLLNLPERKKKKRVKLRGKENAGPSFLGASANSHLSGKFSNSPLNSISRVGVSLVERSSVQFTPSSGMASFFHSTVVPPSPLQNDSGPVLSTPSTKQSKFSGGCDSLNLGISPIASSGSAKVRKPPVRRGMTPRLLAHELNSLNVLSPVARVDTSDLGLSPIGVPLAEVLGESSPVRDTTSPFRPTSSNVFAQSPMERALIRNSSRAPSRAPSTLAPARSSPAIPKHSRPVATRSSPSIPSGTQRAHHFASRPSSSPAPPSQSSPVSHRHGTARTGRDRLPPSPVSPIAQSRAAAVRVSPVSPIARARSAHVTPREDPMLHAPVSPIARPSSSDHAARAPSPLSTCFPTRGAPDQRAQRRTKRNLLGALDSSGSSVSNTSGVAARARESEIGAAWGDDAAAQALDNRSLSPELERVEGVSFVAGDSVLGASFGAVAPGAMMSSGIGAAVLRTSGTSPSRRSPRPAHHRPAPPASSSGSASGSPRFLRASSSSARATGSPSRIAAAASPVASPVSGVFSGSFSGGPLMSSGIASIGSSQRGSVRSLRRSGGSATRPIRGGGEGVLKSDDVSLSAILGNPDDPAEGITSAAPVDLTVTFNCEESAIAGGGPGVMGPLRESSNVWAHATPRALLGNDMSFAGAGLRKDVSGAPPTYHRGLFNGHTIDCDSEVVDASLGVPPSPLHPARSVSTAMSYSSLPSLVTTTSISASTNASLFDPVTAAAIAASSTSASSFAVPRTDVFAVPDRKSAASVERFGSAVSEDKKRNDLAAEAAEFDRRQREIGQWLRETRALYGH